MSNAQWFYTDAQQQQLGPISFEQVQQLAVSGNIQPTTLIWTEGMAEWAQADQVQGIYAAPEAPVAAAPVQLATGVAAAPAANPYAVPGTQVAPAAGVEDVAGAYPPVFVKKTSFGLYLGAYIASILLFAISGLVFFNAASDMAAKAVSDVEVEQRQINEAETRTEMTQAQEAMNAKSDQYTTELDASTTAGLGIGSILGFIAWGLSVFAVIYGYIILYRAWHILQPGGARTTPGAAIGFMFIPLFNLYWIFNAYVGWSTDWNRIRSTYPDLQAAPAASGGMFIAALVCLFTIILSPIGLILLLICTKQMCDTINFIAAKQGLAAGGTVTGTMPKFV